MSLSDPIDRIRRALVDEEAAYRSLGKYQILREVGRGGMAVVYEAYDPDLRRHIALKVLTEVNASPARIERLRREAATAAKLRHPNIVAIYDVASAPDPRGGETNFFAMDFIDGRTLADVLPTLGRRERIVVLEILARAVHYAHEQGIIHRDLKPQNVLMEPATTVDASGLRWRVCLTDFGLAKPLEGEDLTRTGTVIGTPHFMAPEQVQGDNRKMGPETDVWALGVMLYHLLTNRLPFEGQTTPRVYERIVRDEPVPPRRLDATIHADLETICLKALEKEKARRFRAAGALAQELRRHLDGEPISTRPVSALGRLRRRIFRNPVATALSGALLATFVVSAALLLSGRLAIRQMGRAVDVQQALTAAERAEEKYTQELLMPPHDMRPALDRLRRAAEELKPVLDAHPEAHAVWARRAELLRVAGDLDEAERCARRAVEFDDSSAAYWLALARLHLAQHQVFHRQLSESRISPSRPREKSHDECERWLAGAKDAFRRALALPGAERDRRYATALLAFLTGNGAEGLKELNALLQDDPFDLDALMALASIETAPTVESADPVPWAERWAQVARSSVQARVTFGSFLSERGLRRQSRAEDPTSDYDRALQEYGEALRLDEGRLEAWVQRGIVRGRRGFWLMNRGADPREEFRLAEQDLSEALTRNPRYVAAMVNRSWQHTGRAICRQNQGEDPAEEYRAAEEDLRSALELDPDNDWTWVMLGMVRANRAVHLERVGDGLFDEIRRAEEAYLRAVQLNPRQLEAWLGLGIVRANRTAARHKRGEDPSDDARLAEEALREVSRLSPEEPKAWLELARNAAIVAAYVQNQGGDSQDAARQAEEAAREAVRLNRADPEIWEILGMVHANRGTFRVTHGQDPRDDYELALSELDEARRLGSKSPAIPRMLCEILVNRGAFLWQRGLDPLTDFKRAEETSNQLLEADPRDTDAWALRGGLRNNRGLYLQQTGQNPIEDLQLAEADLNEALRLDATHVLSLRRRGMVRHNRGEWYDASGDREKARADFARAADDLAAALQLNPALAPEIEPLLDEVRRKSR